MSETTTDIEETGQQSPGGVGGIGGLRPIVVSDIKAVKRLLSRVLLLLQKRQIDDREARSLGYIAGIFVQTVKESELEQRVGELEKQLPKGGTDDWTNRNARRAA